MEETSITLINGFALKLRTLSRCITDASNEKYLSQTIP